MLVLKLYYFVVDLTYSMYTLHVANFQYIREKYLSTCLFCTGVSDNPDWPQTHHVLEDDLKPLIGLNQSSNAEITGVYITKHDSKLSLIGYVFGLLPLWA